MDIIPPALAFLAALGIVLLIMPPLIRKMKEGGMVGRDINKRSRPEVAELGGIAALFAFALSLSLVIGFLKLTGDISEPPFLAAISVFFIAAMIGLIDDISNIQKRVKALAVLFASLPLLLVHFKVGLAGLGTINIGENAFVALPAGGMINFMPFPFVYWLILVPIGVTGVANAMNMSAGYNGLESGQIAVVGGTLLVVSAVRGAQESLLIFASLLGAAMGLFWFNRYPARAFVGDVGTLGLGAAIGAGVIIGGIELWGLVAMAPAFYEGAATLYFSHKKVDRREACHNPRIAEDGRLSPPPGAERYTLAYCILARRPMTESRLVTTILGLYVASGVIAVMLSLV